MQAFPDAEYRSWDAVSNSRLKLIEESPLHFKLNLPLEEN